MKMLRWLYSRYARSTQIRLTSYFLVVLLPLVAVSLYATDRSGEIVFEESLLWTQSSLRSVADSIDSLLQNAEELSRMMATDEQLILILKQAGPQLSPATVYRFTELIGRLWNVTSISRTVSAVSVYHADSATILSTRSGTRRIGDDAERSWLNGLAAAAGKEVRFVGRDEPTAGGGTFSGLTGAEGISLVRAVDPYNNERKPNLLIVTLNPGRLLQVMKQILPSASSSIELRDKNGAIAAGTGSGPLSAGSGRMIEASAVSSVYGWSLLLQQPEEELYRATRQIRNFTYLIIVISTLLAVLISWGIYTRIASPLQKLSHGMKELSGGNYDLRLRHGREDEFGMVMDLYNRMAAEQKHLIEDYYEQQLKLSRTEMRFLQSQINPHFLYNTLDSIYWTAKNYDAEEISEMVLNLSRFFRLSLHKGKDTFTLGETVAHLDYYVRVQQIRYLDSFRVTYELQEETKALPVMKLLLQPLVENAIQHGLEKRGDGGRLEVRSRLEDGQLVLSVSDNGAGIGAGRLAYIQRELGELGKGRTGLPLGGVDEGVQDLYGLRNVLSRVRMYYGEASGLLIESGEGEGTTVTLHFPLEGGRSGPA
ncbi:MULTISPECIES: sensor histidine kinase [Paenibacillus]|uniref:sensor histidine kinase n=1 Tax=Paenibacillus TaxID=44249 RepID=UPI0022B8F3C3|nr:sensor histidine kinase [Paenibacillus caseinilyticus]MCZ8519833.1 sensor histidine kinase [Paenibacillus caseinilyticus]